MIGNVIDSSDMNLSVPDNHLNAPVDSESDSDSIDATDGYVALAQSAENPMSNDLCETASPEPDSYEMEESRSQMNRDLRQISLHDESRHDGEECDMNRELQSASPEYVQVEPISEDDLEVIKETMSNFVLPESAFPDWAVEVPEEEWIARVTSKIQIKD